MHKDFESALKELSSKLPIKRVYEFVILKYLLNHNHISLSQAKQEVLKYVDNVEEDSVQHAFEVLNQDYYDSGQLRSKLKLIEFTGEEAVKQSALPMCWIIHSLSSSLRTRLIMEFSAMKRVWKRRLWNSTFKTV